MDRERKVIALAEQLATQQLDRRAFVRGALALGVGLPSIAAVLQACAGPEAPSTVGPARPEPMPGTAPMPDLGPMETELNIYNWSDYIADDTVANFEKEFNIKVTYDTYESNEEVVAKLQAGVSGYDLVCPSGYAVQVLLALDLLEKLDRRALQNHANIAPQFRKTAFDPTDAHTVPWQWGRTGIAYRADKVKAPPDSWAVFHDAQYANKMTMMEDMRDAIGAWLRYRGKSLNSIDAAELAAAKTDALAAKKNLQSFISGPVKAQILTGDVWVAQLWDGDTFQAAAVNAEIKWVLPKEGTTIWCDSMCIPKTAPHKRAAHAFLDYILRPGVGAEISKTTGYGSPNAAALASMGLAGAQFPTPDEMKLLEFQMDLGAASAQWDQVWTEIKAG